MSTAVMSSSLEAALNAVGEGAVESEDVREHKWMDLLAHVRIREWERARVSREGRREEVKRGGGEEGERETERYW